MHHDEVCSLYFLIFIQKEKNISGDMDIKATSV